MQKMGMQLERLLASHNLVVTLFHTRTNRIRIFMMTCIENSGLKTQDCSLITISLERGDQVFLGRLENMIKYSLTNINK